MRFISALLVMVLLLSCAARAAGGPVALITNLSGDVKVNGAPGRLLQGLPEGARVQVAQGARVTLSYVRGGLRVYMVGACSMTVQADQPPKASDHISVDRPAARATALLPNGVNFDKMGGARRAEPVSIFVGGLEDPSFPLEWRARQQFAEFEVELLGPDPKPIVKMTMPANNVVRSASDPSGQVWSVYRLPLSAAQREALKPGVDYELRVTGAQNPKGGGATYASTFRVADAKLMAELERAAAEAREQAKHASDPSPQFLMVNLYLLKGMMFPAYHALEGLEVRTPSVQQLLGDLDERLPPQKMVK